MNDSEQRTTTEAQGLHSRKAEDGTVKDAEYWEKKVADAMRRVTQRLAA